jgi:type VI secretion system protein ImpB
MADNSQKFVGRNRAPRVQIEYEVEHYGSTMKVQLPFVMGVLADLSGKLQTDKDGNPIALAPVAERKMLDIDVDNFDERLKALKPRVSFTVPNKLPGSSPDSSLPVDITFTSLDDFSPAAIAKKVEPLRQLLEAREKLDHLITYMDGRGGAEELIAEAINNPALLQALVSVPKPAEPTGSEEKEV